MKATKIRIALLSSLVVALGAVLILVSAPETPAQAQGGEYLCSVPLSSTLDFGLLSCSYAQCFIQAESDSIIVTNTQILHGIVETIALATTDTGWANTSLNGTAIATQTINVSGEQYITSTVCLGDICETLGYSQTAPFSATASSPVTLTHIALAQANGDHVSFIRVDVLDIQAIYTDTGTCDASHLDAAPTPTRTPGPTPMPWATPAPDVMSYKSVQEGIGDWFKIPIPGWITDGLKKITDTINSIDKMRRDVANAIDTTVHGFIFTITEYSPFKLMRGFIIMFSDFSWLGTLFVWFVFAFIVIIAITVIRLVVSMWGIVQRIIELIKLIPFV